MTVPKSADGEPGPSGAPSSTPQPDASAQEDAPSADAAEASDANAKTPEENDTTEKLGAANRRRAMTTKQPPTLLVDFLLGRPSPARVAADKEKAKEIIRQRRMSLEAVKYEMREAAIQRVQAPGGVRDRVTKWQKANAAAMASADPFAAPSEPSEVGVQIDEKSVTEEDRVKIKMRQKKRPPLSAPSVAAKSVAGDEPDVEDQKKPAHTNPPKKRVVSDTNWVKEKPKNAPKHAGPPAKQQEGGGTPLPKNFLSQPAKPLPISKKIQEWASRVEPPDEPVKRPRPPRSVGSKSVGSGDGIRVKPMASEIFSDDDAKSKPDTRKSTTTSEPRRSRVFEDDGIRVRPLPAKEKNENDKTAKSQPKALPDDGIRVRPMRPASRDSTVRAPSPPTTRATSAGPASVPRQRSPPIRREVVQNVGSAESRKATKPRVASKGISKRPSNARPRRAKSVVETETALTEDTHDKESWTSGSESESEIPSTIPPRPLADIPVGYSAFSELELPRGRGERPAMRPKTNRQTSFRGATNALKKALTEGKKILAEAVDPPKPVVNQPTSIESWLKDTVDPFPIDKQDEEIDETQKKPVEKDWAHESKAHRSTSSPQHATVETDDDDSYHQIHEQKSSPKPTYEDSLDGSATTATPSLNRLRRSQATRAVSSPSRSNTKRGFKEKIRDAFRGESSVQVPTRSEYSSYEESLDDDSDRTIEYQERPRSSGIRRSPSPSDEDSSFLSTEMSSLKPKPLNPKRRPPTSGAHELSTIISDAEGQSGLGSEISSMMSDTTMTQPTLTQSGGSLTRRKALSRKRSQNPGLKRRLTKHSDLVSVLSVPDDSAHPSRSRSLRSAHSVGRRVSNRLRDATVDNLLREFIRDENLYSRELKTLVDGVIPVLLSQFVHGARDNSGGVFNSSHGTYKDDPLPKAVVSMGISLEKLKTHHKRCPLADLQKLPQWLETVTPIYENYLDVWRLGFQGIIVNLAPASPDDEDSLIDAMPRNEQGDILNEHGDRIDVAHLLKRPLVRTKWITKFIQGYRAVAGTPQYESLAVKWEALQEKARKRHREETARIIDDDAKKTDTSRARDLETMAAADMVRIDRFRQVYAKDSFSLDLRHSSGQRLNCQVELIYRDNPLFKSDTGDLLIREIGSGGRSWLLFAPIDGNHVSARKGDDQCKLVVMIRGYNDEWYELITLSTDNEDQVLDWLQILGNKPVPPAIKEMTLSSMTATTLSPSSVAMETPVGERKRQSKRSSLKQNVPAANSFDEEPQSPKRHRNSYPSIPTRPPPEIPSTETTSTRDSYPRSRKQKSTSPKQQAYEPYAYTEHEESDPEASIIDEEPEDGTHHAEDGPPPPPAHRTLDANKSPALAPPADVYANLKRRNSSPLKHEYYPSDASSESSFSTSASEGEYSYSDESSDDELEAVEMPDAIPAISIKKDAEAHTASVTSRSSISSMRSDSPSELDTPQHVERPEYSFKSLATISYWDNKRGCWKDLWPDTCSIVTTPGLIEAYPFRRVPTSHTESNNEEDRPLIALDLTPLVMLRTSTALDLEIRSPVLSYARLYTKVNRIETSFFRFRATSLQECETLYMAVHRARLDNAKYKALEEETRIRAFGQTHVPRNEGDGASQSRSWFGRKNSYRASARAPAQSAPSTSHSSMSASSFLKKLMGGGGQFNIAMSSVHRQRGETSLYASSSGTPPRSPSVSAANSGAVAQMNLTTNNLKIRLHLLVSASKWEDYGNCYLEVTRPDQGTRQNLRKYQGMEKRIVVTTIPKKSTKEAQIILDIVLGSRCFSRLGSRGILLNVWEEVRNEYGETGVAPSGGGSGGNVNKWCFQCASVMEASWIYGLVTQEVVIS